MSRYKPMKMATNPTDVICIYDECRKPCTIENKSEGSITYSCGTHIFTQYLAGRDPVEHPSHYNTGKIEVIDAIEAWQLNFHRGNSVKYIARAGKKDPTKELEDLKKAQWYLEREIKRLETKS